MPQVGLSLMPTEDFRRAVLPLLAEGVVDALEWSVDVRYGGGTPDWCTALIDHYAAQGRLYGHGVHLSLFSHPWTERQDAWLLALRSEVQQRRYVHFSEHFGFMTAAGFDRGPPLPMPPVEAVVEKGVRGLLRIKSITGCAVGLENLATVLSLADVWTQGPLLERILAPVDGFLLLDLHNLWCGAVNAGCDPIEVLEGYPLHRVRELHLSGGSWSTHSGARWRRDTHNGPVPGELDSLLEAALSQCPALDVVVLERMGQTLAVDDDVGFREDYHRIRSIVTEAGPAVAPEPPSGSVQPGGTADLGRTQAALLDGLDQGRSKEAIAEELVEPWRSWVLGFDDRAMQVGTSLLNKWGRRT